MGGRTLKKLSTTLSSLLNLSTEKKTTEKSTWRSVKLIEERPTLDDDGWEEFLTDFEDDPSLTYVSPHPVGYWIAKQLEENKKQPVRSSLKEGYDYEKGHIADPSSYSTTKPDIEIRYKV